MRFFLKMVQSVLSKNLPHFFSMHLLEYDFLTHSGPVSSPMNKKCKLLSFLTKSMLSGLVISRTGGPLSLCAKVTISSFVLSPLYTNCCSPFKLEQNFCFENIAHSLCLSKNLQKNCRVFLNFEEGLDATEPVTIYFAYSNRGSVQDLSYMSPNWL